MRCSAEMLLSNYNLLTVVCKEQAGVCCDLGGMRERESEVGEIQKVAVCFRYNFYIIYVFMCSTEQSHQTLHIISVPKQKIYNRMDSDMGQEIYYDICAAYGIVQYGI